MAAMIIAAIALAAVPAAAFAWIATMTAAFCVAYYLGSASLDPKIGAHHRLVAAAGAFGVAAADPLDLRPAADDRPHPHPGGIGPAAAQGI